MSKIINKKIKCLINNPKSCLINNLFSCIYSGVGSIVMFHRVVKVSEKTSNDLCQGLEVTTEDLEFIIKYFMDNNYKIITLDELYDFLKGDIEIESKFVVFTFDDGYLDNFTLAYPLFKKYDIPFAIYIATDFPDKSAKLWWYALSDLIEKNQTINFNYDGNEYNYRIFTQEEKTKVMQEITGIIFMAKEKESILLNELFEKNNIKLSKYADKMTMDWGHIKEISKDKLVTIGAHTVTHCNLRNLPYELAEREINESKKKLERIIGEEISHFAFPFGTKNEASIREFEMIQKLGFKTAVTTRQGNVFKAHKNYMYCLPRISPHHKNEFPFPKYYVSGFLPALINRFKRIITD